MVMATDANHSKRMHETIARNDPLLVLSEGAGSKPACTIFFFPCIRKSVGEYRVPPVLLSLTGFI